MSLITRRPSDGAVRNALREAHTAGKKETVVFRLRGEGVSAVPLPADTERLANALVERAASHCRRRPERFNIFRNLGSFVVRADADFLTHLLGQPEVAAATINRTEEARVEPIRPVRKSHEKPEGWVELSDTD